MGHSSNAFDIDDGHNLTRAHPGTSFVGAVLAAAYEKNVSLKEFLTAMLVAYEVTVRSGAAIMDYYKFAHSSGTFGAVGVDWLAEKFYRITARVISSEKQKSLIAKLCGDVNAPVRDIVDLINE